MERLSDRSIQSMSQFLTTEHFTLQGARNGTIAEANGRVGHYLSTVGSGLVALAFVANASKLQPVFLAFAAVILPMMIVMGAVTLVRIIQIGIHDNRLAQAINRIRHYYYAEVAPEVEAYISFPRYDDPDSVMHSMMPSHIPLQGLAATPGPLVLINSVLCGAFAGIVSAGFLTLPVLPAVVISLVVLAVAFVLHWTAAGRLWARATRQEFEIRFPPPEA
jgi:hypothetical protein